MEFTDLEAVIGRIVRSGDGREIGSISALHLDQQTDKPLFAEVATRWREKNLVVPIKDATVEGKSLVLPFDADDLVKGPAIAPNKTMSIAEVLGVVRYYDVGQVSETEMPEQPERSGAGYEKKPLPPIVYRFESVEDYRHER